jgi:hypothetical protein
MWWEGGGEFHAPHDLTWPATYEKIVLNVVVFCVYKSKKCMNSIMKRSHGCAPKAKFPLIKKRRKTTWCGWRRPPSCMILDLPKYSNSHHVKSQHVGLSSHETEQKRERSTAFLRASSTAGSCGMSCFFSILDPCCYPTLCTWYPPKNYIILLLWGNQ